MTHPQAQQDQAPSIQRAPEQSVAGMLDETDDALSLLNERITQFFLRITDVLVPEQDGPESAAEVGELRRAESNLLGRCYSQRRRVIEMVDRLDTAIQRVQL